MDLADSTSLILCARVRPGSEGDFAQWNARCQTAVLASPGAINFEFRPPAPPDQTESVVVVRFETLDALRLWRHSDRNRELIEQAVPLVEGGVVMQLSGAAASDYYGQHGTTEVVITDIKRGREEEYRAWADRIQKVQETFPGYLGSFVQPPHQKEPGWTTVLRFRSNEDLENWLNSEQRKALITEAEPLIVGFHAQKVDTSFPGWAPVNPVTGKPPNMWKTASLVLLTLFPVIMLELRFLSPYTKALPPAVGTFIGNAISVAVTTWPLMPLAIRAFHFWIFPENQPRWLVLAGPAIVALCYAIEIAVLWRLI